VCKSTGNEHQSIASAPGALLAVALVLIFPGNAFAACKEKLASVDTQLASTEFDATVRDAVQQFRDQAAALCDQGHEATAMQTLQIVDMMLMQVATEQATQERRAAPAASPPSPSIEEQLAAGRADFPNRWDRLSQMNFCQWLTTEELERGLTLWHLEYLRPDPKRDRYYSPSPGRSGNADLGPRFLEMLVDKYKNKL
jgi:hypothetical protein